MNNKRPRWESEMMSNNIVPDDISCKDCMFRTVLIINGVKCERYKNIDCELYVGNATGFKPDEIMSGEAECEFYEMGEPIPQEYVPENYISPHHRD